MEFDSPARLQRRILEAAGDFSEDVSLPGMGRRAPSAASESFMSSQSQSHSHSPQSTSTIAQDQQEEREHQDTESERNGFNNSGNGMNGRNSLPSFNISKRMRLGGVGVGKDSTNHQQQYRQTSNSDFELDSSISQNNITDVKTRNPLSLASALENQNKNRTSAYASPAPSSLNDTARYNPNARNKSSTGTPNQSSSISKTERIALSRSNQLDRSTDTVDSQSSNQNQTQSNNNHNHNHNHSISIPVSSTPQSNNTTKSIISTIGNDGKSRSGSGESIYSQRIRESVARKPKIGTLSSPGGVYGKDRLKSRPSNLTNRTSLSNESWKTGNEGGKSRSTNQERDEDDDEDEEEDEEGKEDGTQDQDDFRSTRNSNFSSKSKSNSKSRIDDVDQDRNPNSDPNSNPDPTTTSSASTSFIRPESRRRKSEVSNLNSESGATTRTMHTSDILPSFDVRNARHAIGSTSDAYQNIGIDNGDLPRRRTSTSVHSSRSLPRNQSITYDDVGVEQDQDQEEVKSDLQLSNQPLDRDELTQDEQQKEDNQDTPSVNQRSETNDTYTRDISHISDSIDITPAINPTLNNGRKNFGIRISPGMGNNRNGRGISPTPSPENTNRSSSVIGMTNTTRTPRFQPSKNQMKDHVLNTLQGTQTIAQSRRHRDILGIHHHNNDNNSMGRTPRIRKQFDLENTHDGSSSLMTGEEEGNSTSPLRSRIGFLVKDNRNSSTPGTIKNSRIQNLLMEDGGDGISYASSESSNDLMIPARQKGIRRGNTSLPGGIGSMDTPNHFNQVGPSLANVDPIKMSQYQITIQKNLEISLENANLMIEDKEKRIKDLENNWNKALRELELLKKSQDEKISPVNNDEDHTINSEDQGSSLRKEGVIGDETYQEIQTDLDYKDNRINQLEMELKGEKEKSSELEKEAEELFDATEEIRKERDELLKKIKEGKEIREKNVLIRSRSRVSKSKLSQHSEAEEEIEEEEEKNDSQRQKSKEELEIELTELIKDYDELHESYSELQKERLNNEENMNELKIHIEEKFNSLEERKDSEIHLLENQINSLKEDLKVNQSRITRLQEERETLISESKNQNDNGDDSKIFQTNDKIDSLEIEINELKKELNQKDEELDSIEEEYSLIQQELDLKVSHLQDCEIELLEVKDERDSIVEDANRRFNDLLKDSEEKENRLEEEIGLLREELKDIKFSNLHSEIDNRSSKKVFNLSSSSSAFNHDLKKIQNSCISISKEEESLLQKELDEAYLEIGKLRHQIQISIENKNNLVGDIEESRNQKDEEINQLRFEVEILNKRLEGIKDQHLSFSNVGNDSQATPKKNHYQHKGIRDLKNSPFNKIQMNSSGILNEISWLNNESVGENSVIGKIQILQAQLGSLNADIDLKLDNWPALKAKETSEKLVIAEKKISELEFQLSELKSNQKQFESSSKRSSNRRSSHSSNFLSKSSSEQSSAYQKVVNELLELKSNWENDINDFKHQKSEMEKIRNGLQSKNDVMSKEVERQKERERVQKLNARKATETVHQQLERARRVTQAFGSELKEGRLHLEALDTKSRESLISRSEIESRLSETESKFSLIQETLKSKQKKYEELNSKLLENSRNAGEVQIELSKLSNEILETKYQISELKLEKTSILNEKLRLNKEFELMKISNRNISEELKIAKEAMFAHQEQLDDQVTSIENLHLVLNERNLEFEKIKEEKDELSKERGEILNEVKCLYDTLIRLRKDGGVLSEEMLKLRDERDLWRRKEMEMRNLVEKLKRQSQRVELEISNHQCLGDQSNLIAKHASECKGLMLQIRYLKTKFMRESDLRSDLSHQKSYLLQLIGGLELSESATAQFIADIGISRGTTIPLQTPGKRFKKVAIVVRVLVRMDQMAKRWRNTCETKTALREAHQANIKMRGIKERN